MVQLERFESLGDNCEFGFFERFHGREVGSLLRWAVTPPESLAKAIRSGFSGIYDFEYLMPNTDGMVRDTRSGIAFHSRMASKDNVFLANDQDRYEIFKGEQEKINYLTAKILDSLSKDKIFICKKTGVYRLTQPRI